MDKPFEILLQNGLAGAIMVLMALSIAVLFRSLQTAQDSRITDLLNFKDTIDNNTQSNRQVADAVRTLGEKIERQAERHR